MAARRHQHQPVFGEGRRLEFGRGVDRIRHDPEVGPAARDRAHDLRAPPFLDVEVDLGMACQEAGEERRQEFQGRRGVGQQANPSPQSLGELCELAAHLVELLGDETGMVGERETGRRRRDAAAPALEQGRTERLLHVADALACRSEGEAAACRAVRDAGRFVHVQDQLKIDQVESHAVKIAFGTGEG